MKTLILGIAAAIIVVAPSTASALSLTPLQTDLSQVLANPKPIAAVTPKPKAAKPPAQATPPAALPVVTYNVVSGDNLTKIGMSQNVEWLRIWAKNTNIANPDLINVGDVLIIPAANEDLPSRPLPTPAPVVASASPLAALSTPVQNSVHNSDGGPNTYDYGYCTWYVKNKRPDLPNSLGNANTWYSRAQAMGLAVGSAPRVGAAGTTTRGSLGHVVYVEGVNGDGTVNISEMNSAGWGVVDYRTVPASDYLYIY